MKWSEVGFKILIYISLLFLGWYLWKFDYVKLQHVYIDRTWGLISLFFLFSGFILSTVSWRFALYFHGIKVTYRKALVSHGMSIFAKYIPGKLWVILGRASFISQQEGQLKQTSFISLKEQLLYILLGLCISLVPSIYYFKISYLNVLLLGTITLLALILFNGYVHRFTEFVLGKIFKKGFELPQLKLALAGKLFIYILFYWLAWTIGFYALTQALIPNTGIIAAFAFPLSVCYGVLAIIMPGGLGVREGVMVTFLLAVGVQLEQAITLSIIARLWYMAGEVFLFISALALRKKA